MIVGAMRRHQWRYSKHVNKKRITNIKMSQEIGLCACYAKSCRQENTMNNTIQY